MSSTRHASEDSPFRQERYMSSPEMVRGLLATCVAARVKALCDPAHRKLIWWLQKVSWEQGGLDELAREIVRQWPERLVTRSMAHLGFGERRIYSAAEVRLVRKEMPWDLYDGEFLLCGEATPSSGLDELLAEDYSVSDYCRAAARDRRAIRYADSQARPESYPASAFAQKCRKAAESGLEKFLFEELCLNPALSLDESPLWYFPRLVETLAELHDQRAVAAGAAAPVTEIGKQVEETLEYALAERGLVVVEGVARTGKTFSVKAWCAANPGRARYVQVPSSNDDMSFFRALAEALGIGTSHAYKAHELRRRIEDVLQCGDLLLCLDEAHYAWPQRNMRKAVPHRINWILTQLVNMGVPVALITTPQFTKSQEALVQHGGWSSEQFIGRIDHYERLPDLLGEGDLEAVARHWLPSGEAKAIRLLIKYAETSEKYLQGIQVLVRRARFLAGKKGREQPTFTDVAAALKEGVVPSDNALAAAVAAASGGAKGRGCKPSEKPVQTHCSAPARALQPAPAVALDIPDRDTGAAVLSP